MSQQIEERRVPILPLGGWTEHLRLGEFGHPLAFALKCSMAGLKVTHEGIFILVCWHS